MKSAIFGFMFLCSLSLAFAETTTTTSATPPSQETSQSNVATDVRLDSPTASRVGSTSPVMSTSEAEQLRVHEGRLLATSDMEAIKVGNVGSNDLIYILVVVLLVVVIIAVI